MVKKISLGGSDRDYTYDELLQRVYTIGSGRDYIYDELLQRVYTIKEVSKRVLFVIRIRSEISK